MSIRDQAIEKVKTTSGNYSVGLNFASPLLKNNFIRSWRILRYDMNSCDVTLACVDGEIGAHKVILSSVSPVFKRLLSKKFYKHPYLYLRGMRYSQILAFLDYIYLGEVSVDKQNIDKFIDIIKEFKIGEEEGKFISDQVDMIKEFKLDEEAENSTSDVIHAIDEIKIREDKILLKSNRKLSNKIDNYDSIVKDAGAKVLQVFADMILWN